MILLLAMSMLAVQKPIALHPRNPHYFLFRSKPTVLITSGEHYGAVLNGAFDYRKYLDELKKDGLNLTRTFSGVYREVIGNFKIAENTLAPKPEDFIAPWPRSSASNSNDGLGKFDLTKWNEAYFDRLKTFVREAGKRGVVVELVLFCPFYEDSMWKVSPMNAANNVQGIGTMPRDQVYTLKYPEMLALHDSVTRKIVGELAEFDNLYYEICNEPYFGGVTLAWQRHISQTIADADHGRHLISQNIANGSAKITDPDPRVSIFNFHYASPPNAVAENYGLNCVIANNETGFAGTADATYRAQAWEFMFAGGGAFNNLDYSFTANHPTGDFQYPNTQPGGGSRAYRRQLGILKKFLAGFDLLRFKSEADVISGTLPAGVAARAFSSGESWAIYLRGGAQTSLVLHLPAGSYRAEWVNTHTGDIDKAEEVVNSAGLMSLSSPAYQEDIALRIRAVR